MTDIYDRFLSLPWAPCFDKHPPAEEAELECVIVEPRKHANLAGVLRNMSAMIPYAALTVVCSRENADFVADIVGGGTVRIVPLFEGNITRDQYNDLLKSERFWGEIVKADKVLIFQTDSGILRNMVLHFINYDYIGAPWTWLGEVGNGGLSLRSRRAMIDVIRTYKSDVVGLYVPEGGRDTPEYYNEDIYFTYGMKHMSIVKPLRIPALDVAGGFSIEYNSHERPMGFHQAYAHHPREYVEGVLLADDVVECPRDDVVDILDAWIECAHGQYRHPRLVGWLRLGISRSGFSIPEKVEIPFVHREICGTLFIKFTRGPVYEITEVVSAKP